jgi:hypothetical protein
MSERGPVPEDPRERADARPRIDVSGALGEGGHEVEQLGFEGVPDTGPALQKPDESRNDAETEIDRVANEFPPD